MTTEMLMRLPSQGYDLLVDLVADLAAGHFDQLEADGRAGRCTSKELADAVKRYGKTLLPMGLHRMRAANTYNVNKALSPTWIVELDLETAEEGQSDLTLSCLLTETAPSKYHIEINDIRVC